jgi:hypothetical protein
MQDFNSKNISPESYENPIFSDSQTPIISFNKMEFLQTDPVNFARKPIVKITERELN